MKKTPEILLFLIFLSLSCTQHFEAAYTLNCEFPTFGLDGRLIVMDHKGNEMESFYIPNGTTSFSEKVLTNDPDAPDTYDLYMIYPDPYNGQSSGFNYIYTQLGVKNGSKVFVFPTQPVGINTADQFSAIRIQNVGSLQQLEAPVYATNNLFSTYLEPNSLVEAYFVRMKGQGVLIRAMANGEPTPRNIYLPDSLLGQGIFLDLFWSDLKPEGNFKSVEMPEGFICKNLEVSAVSEDLRSFTKLWPPSSTASMLGFNLPEGLPVANHFAIRAEAENLLCERIFKPGEPLVFSKNNLDIVSWDNTDVLNIQTQGTVDLVTLEGSNSGNYWKISGRPDVFKQKKLPDLSQWIKNWDGSAPYFRTGIIRAYNFDLYEYPEIQAGYPFRSSEWFVNARSGYTEVWKTY